MKNEERQALIAECNRGIKNTNRWLRANKDIGNPENAAKKQLQIYEIALSALTSEPATKPESEDYRNLKELYHAQEKRLFKLAQSIKGPEFDKYSHTTSQAIDVLESALTAEPVAWEVKGILCHTKEDADKYVGTPVPLIESLIDNTAQQYEALAKESDND